MLLSLKFSAHKMICCFLLPMILVAGCAKSAIKRKGCSDPPLTGILCIPNIYTPNGDGVNDVLYVRCSDPSQITAFQFTIKTTGGIFNHEVFSTTDIIVGWDGTYKGKKVKSGIYQYEVFAILNTAETIEVKGKVACLVPEFGSETMYKINDCSDCRYDTQYDPGISGFDESLPSNEYFVVCE
jgi:gliding motility-associated-like protein